MNNKYFNNQSCFQKERYCHYILTIILSIISLPLINLSASEMSRDDLLSIIRGLEKDYMVIETKMTYKTYKVPTNIDESVDYSQSISSWLSKAEPTGKVKNTYYITEPFTGRIYFTREGTTEIWTGDSSEISEFRRELAFDGQSRSTLIGPFTQTQTGIIEDEPLRINKELSSFEMGMDMLLPCYKGIGLSGYLQSEDIEKTSIRARLDDNGLLELSYIEKAHQQQHRLQIDLSKNGAILSEEYFGTGIYQDIVSVKMEYKWKENDSGQWIPLSGIGVSGLVHPKVNLWDYEEVKINHLEPEPGRYQVKFPAGTEVADRRIGIKYVVGELPYNVKKETQELLITTYKINPELADNARAVQMLSKSQNLSSELELEEKSDSQNNDITSNNEEIPVLASENNLLNNIMFIAGIVMFILFVALLRYVRVLKKSMLNKTMLFIGLISIALISQSSFAKDNNGITSEEFDGWTIKGVGSERIQVYQCGLNSTAYLLEYFNVDYMTEQLMQLMNPTLNGISLSEIMSTLQLYGLESKAFGGKTVEDLFKELNTNQIALLPTNTTGEKGHYLVIVPGRKDDLMVVDAGRGIYDNYQNVIKKILKKNQGVVVYVSSKEGNRDISKISISPEICELGQFIYPSEKEVSGKYIIKNNSKDKILIKNILTSCSCMAHDCIGKIINEGEQYEVKISVQPGGWGIGEKSKGILFVFGDGSNKNVKIHGECKNAMGLHDITVTPEELYVNIEDEAQINNITRNITVHTQSQQIYVESENPQWLNVELSGNSSDALRTIKIEIDASEINEQKLTTYLNVWSKENLPKMKIPIHLLFSKKYVITPRIGKILREQEDAKAYFELTSLDEESEQIEIANVSCNKSDVFFEEEKQQGRNILKVSLANKDIETGMIPIDLMVSSSNKREYEETVYLLVE